MAYKYTITEERAPLLPNMKAGRWRICPTCLKEFRAKLNGSRKGPVMQVYCTQACGIEAKRKLASLKAVLVKTYKTKCKECEAWISSRRPGKTLCSYACAVNAKRAHLPRHCKACGVWFSPVPKMGKPVDTCSAECSAVGQKHTKKEHRLTETYKKYRRKAKSARRAKARGVYAEAIDPIAIFESEGWRCWLCGVKTLKSKRGTTHPLAPELDHMIPLAKGGAHSFANVACACRACNAKKADKVI